MAERLFRRVPLYILRSRSWHLLSGALLNRHAGRVPPGAASPSRSYNPLLDAKVDQSLSVREWFDLARAVVAD
jgi:hypothetical protein